MAGVPGMVGAMARHLLSLRRLRRDHGWIHTLLGQQANSSFDVYVQLPISVKWCP